MPLPAKIAAAPELLLGLEFYFSVFLELQNCRDVAFGAGPLRTTTILDYARGMELDEHETDMLVFHLRKMDNEYLKWNNAKKGGGDG